MKRIVTLLLSCILGHTLLIAQESQTYEIEKLEKPEKLLITTSSKELFSKLDKDFLHLSITTPLVEKGTHPVLTGFLEAYQEHRPVTLSPDIIWLLICQGFAQHINNNAEELRNKFVNFKDQKELTVSREVDHGVKIEDFPWASIFPDFTQKIGEYVGQDLIETLTANYTTTTPSSQIASQITIMESMKKYFTYKVMMVGCGIPAVTIEGNVSDWKKIDKKLNILEQYDLKWWVKELKPIIREIIKTKQGKMNRDFWMNMVRFHKEGIYGSLEDIDGWLVKFYPYLSNGNRSDLKKISDISTIPHEMVRIPFKFQIQLDHQIAQTLDLEFWAGFMGLQQNPETFNLKPEIGWAINKTNPEEKDPNKKARVFLISDE